jgi:NADH-quinone oxidoreductase subunit A
MTIVSGYIAILTLLLIVVGVAAAIMFLSRFFGPRRPLASKLTTYECGVEPRKPGNDMEDQVPIKYATVALIFIVFDVETVFFLPWAVIFREQIQAGAVVESLVFIGIFVLLLLLGLVYIYRRNVLQWD